MAGIQKKTPEINGVQLADISFILLIFFMMVTTMGSEFGMIRQLPPMQDETEGEKINERNILLVFVNMNNQLMVRGEISDISTLRQTAKDFFELRNTGDNYPAKKQEDLGPLLGMTVINEGAVISLQNDRGTSYKTYMQVQNELTAAVRELRDEFSMQRFGWRFEEDQKDPLKMEIQDAISKTVYPMAISEAEPRDASVRR
jgi:biopolymer transport protein ExbD